MEDAPDSQAVVEIQVVGRVGIIEPTLQVFIDGKSVGALKGKSAQSYHVAPGVRKVTVKRGNLCSETLGISFSAGERVAIECGFHIRRALRFHVIYAMLAAASVSGALIRLPFWALAVVCLQVVTMGIQCYWMFITPGGYVYLRSRTAQQVLESQPPHSVRLSQLTIGRSMIVIAITAVLLAIGVKERLMQRRADAQRRSSLYQFRAELHSEQEKSLKNGEQVAELEEATQKYLNALETLSAITPKNTELIKKIKDQKRFLESVRSIRAGNARRAAYHASLKAKYLRAASRPWEPIDDDPPPP